MTRKDLTPLLDTILEHVPPANTPEQANLPLKAQVFNLGYDNFLGRLAVCRIYDGIIKDGQNVFVKKINGKTRPARSSKFSPSKARSASRSRRPKRATSP